MKWILFYWLLDLLNISTLSWCLLELPLLLLYSDSLVLILSYLVRLWILEPKLSQNWALTLLDHLRLWHSIVSETKVFKLFTHINYFCALLSYCKVLWQESVCSWRVFISGGGPSEPGLHWLWSYTQCQLCKDHWFHFLYQSEDQKPETTRWHLKLWLHVQVFTLHPPSADRSWLLMCRIRKLLPVDWIEHRHIFQVYFLFGNKMQTFLIVILFDSWLLKPDQWI